MYIFICLWTLWYKTYQCMIFVSTDAIAGHDPIDSTTYHSKPFQEVQLSTVPSVKGLRVGIPEVC